MTIPEIMQAYAMRKSRHDKEYADLHRKLNACHRRLAYLNNRLEKLPPPTWTEYLLKPVVEKLKPHFPQYRTENIDISLMKNNRAVAWLVLRDIPEGKDEFDDETSIYIIFIPGNLDKGELFLYDENTEQKVKLTGTDQLVSLVHEVIRRNSEVLK